MASNQHRGLLALCAGLALFSSCNPVIGPSPTIGHRRSEIIGGVTERGHWYVVMVGNSGGPFCSGTVISRRTVITAGHCWGTGADQITRVYFETGPNLTSSVISVVNSIRHPSYNDTTLTHDLTLLQLSADAPVQAVPLLRETLNAGFIGPKFTFAGYGDTDPNGNGFGTRRVVTFPIGYIGPNGNIPLPPNAPASASDSIDATQFYYRLPNKNTCEGDSGGPAFVVRNGVERHAGVTSYGDDQCAFDGVQARTDALTMGWIQQTIDGFEPGGACRADGVCGAGCVTTAPAPLGTMGDPDCADAHCGSDGVCVLSCSPVDPDCSSLNINNCIDNGICQPGCAVPDPDCPTGSKAVGAVCSSGGDCLSGSCVTGVCCSTACSGACQACAAADGAPQDGTCGLRSAGALCRPSAGTCDVAESCTGASPTCPPDVVAPTTTVCRASTGGCDAEERCDGNSGACPPDGFSVAGAVCRAAAHPCDQPEVCSGADAVCPSDVASVDGTACEAGVCEMGACVPPGTQPPPGGCGCGAGGASPLLLGFWWVVRRLTRRGTPERLDRG